MDRKAFLKTAGLGSLALGISSPLSAAELLTKSSSLKKITILHTNDQHSRIEPFDSTYKRNPNQGGFARRAALVHQIRQQEPNVILLDCGDTFQGTPYFNTFGGELEFKLMSMMKYDASTMGNHDFDNGLEGFMKVLPHANFPFICSNYDFKNTILEGKTLPYKIMKKDGVRIGLFGVGIDLEGLVSKKDYKETEYLHPTDIAQHYAHFLKYEKKCDLVVCISHLGYKYRDNSISDVVLASQTEDIDLIIGGHTHTFLPEPQKHTNRKGKTVLVNQVGWAGLLLGKVDFFFDKHKNIQHIAWHNQAIDNTILV